jgi:hypothetical protein
MSWLDLCDDYKIPYKKASKDNIEVACAFCGPGHSGHKLGLNVVTGEYGCWRNAEYRGRNPIRAVQVLVNCDWEQAKHLTTLYFNWSFDHIPVVHDKADIPEIPVKKPADFLSFGAVPILEKPFINYLKNRNFDPNYVIQRFDLHYCINGKYAHRIVIPLMFGKDWYGWTARTILNTDAKRYITCGDEETTNKITNFLFDEQNLKSGDKLIIAEGPLDAIMINSCLLPGIQATSLFGQQISDKQLLKLVNLKDKFGEMILALDQDAYLSSIKMATQIKNFIPDIKVISPPAKDWGACSIPQIKEAVYA